MVLQITQFVEFILEFVYSICYDSLGSQQLCMQSPNVNNSTYGYLHTHISCLETFNTLQKGGLFMRNKTKLISILLTATLFIGVANPIKTSVTTAANDDNRLILEGELVSDDDASLSPDEDAPTATTKPTDNSDTHETEKRMGLYYMAKGQPCVFQDPQKGRIKVISASGNRYKVSGNKITITCKKKGTIKYEINGKKKLFIILSVGGNHKDTKVNKKEYNFSTQNYKGKSYKNFIDCVLSMKKDKYVNAWVTYSSKKELAKNAKYNRGVTYGTPLKKMEKQYPSWEDLGSYKKDECCYAARYYDKKSDYVFVKGFVLNKKHKVKKIVYIAYDPLHKSEIIKLRSY